MHSPSFTADEDRVLLSYIADLDPEDYEKRVSTFTERFRKASLKLPGRSLDAVRKRYKRLIRFGKPELTPVNPEPVTPYRKVETPMANQAAQAEVIDWDEPFIRPPSKDQLMGRR